MFRKMLVALGATAGLLVPAIFPATAEAHPSIEIGIGFARPAYYPPSYYPPSYFVPSYYPPVVLPPPVIPIQQFEVLYRRSHCEPWRLYGTYHSHHRAHDIEEYLESRGYDARVIHR